MGDNTKIEWCDATFNPWEGCQKVGPGCDHCYAESRNARFGGGAAPNWGPGAPRRRTSDANWRKPLAWNEDAAAKGVRYRVFCASLADVFDNEVHPDWRSDLFELIHRTPHLDWLLLTKRIGNVQRMMWDDAEIRTMPANVWLGATIVNQEEADRDIPKLLATPAAKRFLSMEPLLGTVDIRWALGGPLGIAEGFLRRGMFSPGLETLRPLDWVIVGGESGKDARRMYPGWGEVLRDQCAAAGVPFLFKQWGEWAPSPGPMREGDVMMMEGQEFIRQGRVMRRVGKKAAGRLLDGVQHDGIPA